MKRITWTLALGTVLLTATEAMANPIVMEPSSGAGLSGGTLVAYVIGGVILTSALVTGGLWLVRRSNGTRRPKEKQ